MVKQLSKKILLLMAIFIWCSTAVMAQSGNVSGTITDALDGATLPGATVLVKGTVQGTITDIDGKYTISVEPNATLVFSYIGYQTQEISVQPNQTINVVLEMSATGLSELVVIGYGIQKKEDATGSVAAVEAKEFNQGAIVTPANLITGKVAGVQVTTAGGTPGAGVQIRIRGGSSLSASNDPLFVIDGVPVDNEGISGSRNPMNNLNPNDIESFSVLKDASATAIYGSRASNGVVIITTKKGTEGMPMKLQYTGNFTLYTPTRMQEVLSPDQFRTEITQRHPTRVDMMGDANTDWQNEIFSNAFGMDHNISVTGAAKHMPYRVSIGYTGTDGILKTDNMKRTTLSFALNPNLLDNHLKLNINGQGAYVKNQFADWGAFGAATQFDPTQPVHDSEGKYGGYWAWLQANGDPVDQATTNPVALLDLRKDLSTVYNMIGNVGVDYNIHGFEDLKATLNLGYNYSKGEGTVNVPEYAAWAYDPLTGGGVDNQYEQEKKNELLDFYLTYTKDLSSIQSNLEVMAGYSWQHFWRKNYSINSDIAHTPSKTDTLDDPTESYLVSFFGRLNYIWKNRYLLTFTLRNDGTSRFSPDTRWGLFPSVALAWKIDEENFMKNADVLSQLKLRLGWGVTGQQGINQGDYPYLPVYTTSQVNAQYQMGGQYYYTLRAEGYDANIKWEETTTYNIGLDYGFAKDRYWGTLDFYYRETKDLLNFIPVPAGSNLTNYILTNIGDLENTGVEFSIMTRPIVKNDLVWEIGFNATYNVNKITKLTATDDPDYLGEPTGGISGGVGNNIQIHSVGYPTYSYFVFEQVYDNDGNPIQGMYVDRNGDGEITNADKYHYKKPASDFWFGLNSSVSWKQWEFAFSGRANFGNYVYNNVASENGVYERLYRPEGPYLSNISTYVYQTNFENPQYMSDYFIQNGAFFRMDYMALSYQFEELGGSKLDLRLSATVNNAFTITDYEGLDPEIQNGIDNNIYPRPRAYVLGINLLF